MNGISVLIPVYNDDPTPLLSALLIQYSTSTIPVEIIVMDDASQEDFFQRWNNAFHHSPFQIFRSEHNIGRAAIRNELIKKATFDWLLFLDADTLPHDSDYLQRYIPLLTDNNDAICGGTAYRKEPPSSEKRLRWIFGKAREERSAVKRNKHAFEGFTLNNLLIRKEIMQRFPLDHTIQTYGHEDTLLGMQLLNNGIRLFHTDNFVYHEGLDDNDVFLNKVEESVKTLVHLYQSNTLPADTRLISLHKKLTSFGLNRLFFYTIKTFIPFITKNLLSPSPSLRIMDLFKLWKFEYYLNKK